MGCRQSLEIDNNSGIKWNKDSKKFYFKINNRNGPIFCEFEKSRTKFYVANYTQKFEDFLRENENREIFVNYCNFVDNIGEFGKIQTKNNFMELCSRNSSGIIEYFKLIQYDGCIKNFRFKDKYQDKEFYGDLFYSSYKTSSNETRYLISFNYDFIIIPSYNFRNYEGVLYDITDLRFINSFIIFDSNYCYIDIIDKTTLLSLRHFKYKSYRRHPNNYGYDVLETGDFYDNYIEEKDWENEELKLDKLTKTIFRKDDRLKLKKDNFNCEI